MEKPRILLLDEPTHGHDTAGDDQVFALLDAFRAEGVAIIWVSHGRDQTAHISYRILKLSAGALTE